MRIGLLPRFYLRHSSCRKPRNPRADLFLHRLWIDPSLRQLTCLHRLRQDDRPRKQQAHTRVPLPTEKLESIKPESYHETREARPDDAPKTNALLSEQTVSNKEQRKADWAIMKEMAVYLWPKVGRMVTLGAEENLKRV